MIELVQKDRNRHNNQLYRLVWNHRTATFMVQGYFENGDNSCWVVLFGEFEYLGDAEKMYKKLIEAKYNVHMDLYKTC